MNVVRFLHHVPMAAVKTHPAATDVCVIQDTGFRRTHAQVKCLRIREIIKESVKEKEEQERDKERDAFSTYMFLCVCLLDINECENHLQCRGQVCVNTPGSYRCTSCGVGFRFHNGQCTGQHQQLCHVLLQYQFDHF